ncbi:hypothetical protein GALL_159920 [mine drainage metagenome]|uniref:Uncharacterized protein n=1 Tax=mine drainage metagenome TaxID=410659 RepID=A0A1J5S0J1_9ZZZZ
MQQELVDLFGSLPEPAKPLPHSHRYRNPTPNPCKNILVPDSGFHLRLELKCTAFDLD